MPNEAVTSKVEFLSTGDVCYEKAHSCWERDLLLVEKDEIENIPHIFGGRELPRKEKDSSEEEEDEGKEEVEEDVQKKKRKRAPSTSLQLPRKK